MAHGAHHRYFSRREHAQELLEVAVASHDGQRSKSVVESELWVYQRSRYVSHSDFYSQIRSSVRDCLLKTLEEVT